MRHMNGHRRRGPSGNIKVAVGEAHGSLTPMSDLTKARLLVNVLHTLPADMNIPRTSHHRKKKKQSLPAPCAVPAMLRRGSSAAWGLLLGYDYLLHVACSAHLSLVHKPLFICAACHVSNRNKAQAAAGKEAPT